MQDQDKKRPKHDLDQYATGMITIAQVIDGARSLSD